MANRAWFIVCLMQACRCLCLGCGATPSARLMPMARMPILEREREREREWERERERERELGWWYAMAVDMLVGTRECCRDGSSDPICT